MIEGQNGKYRDTIVKNEGVLTSQTKELRDVRKRMEVTKATTDRLKDENAVLVKQNKKLVEEMQEMAEDDLRAKQIGNRNEQAIIDGGELNADQLKERLRQTQDAQVQDRRQFDAGQAAISQEMGVTREANAQLKEDYEILEERFKKNQTLNENLVNDLKDDQKGTIVKLKKLQEFFDKYDTILQEERNAAQSMQKQLNDDKDKIERTLTKELDESQTELATLKGEFKVKMMRITLQELELENKLKDFEEHNEEKDQVA